ncbi:MAG: imidazole glycerol phosphate synthase subunit HisH [Alphaproteobacteria bacterium]|nr:imidazole glycerol phosphate synthase subunit HisH [Alphaproteobacteria bacterium]
METVALIDYGSGNIRSVQKALQRASRESGLSTAVIVTSDAQQVASADRLVLPGVGAFRACYQGLVALPGMMDALDEAVRLKARPFLGVCVGMQLLATRGHEYGLSAGLGLIAGDVLPLSARAGVISGGLRVPHMGWNDVSFVGGQDLGDRPDEAFYFAHSFYFDVESDEDVIAVCDYGGPLPVGVQRGNVMGFQFHPEKSQGAGIALLAAFLRWRP